MLPPRVTSRSIACRGWLSHLVCHVHVFVFMLLGCRVGYCPVAFWAHKFTIIRHLPSRTTVVSNWPVKSEFLSGFLRSVETKAADDSMMHDECSSPHPHVREKEEWNVYNTIGNHQGIVVHVHATMEIWTRGRWSSDRSISSFCWHLFESVVPSSRYITSDKKSTNVGTFHLP